MTMQMTWATVIKKCAAKCWWDLKLKVLILSVLCLTMEQTNEVLHCVTVQRTLPLSQPVIDLSVPNTMPLQSTCLDDVPNKAGLARTQTWLWTIKTLCKTGRHWSRDWGIQENYSDGKCLKTLWRRDSLSSVKYFRVWDRDKRSSVFFWGGGEGHITTKCSAVNWWTKGLGGVHEANTGNYSCPTVLPSGVSDHLIQSHEYPSCQAAILGQTTPLSRLGCTPGGRSWWTYMTP